MHTLPHARPIPAYTRSTQPRAALRPIAPEQLKQLICDQGHSCSSAAKILGVCTNTVSVAAVRLGLTTVNKHKKLAPDLRQQIKDALEHYATVAQVALRFGLSDSSVYRFLRMHPELARQHKQRMLEREKLVRRMQFMQQIKYSKLTACADYYWLRRNDRAWMENFLLDPA